MILTEDHAPVFPEMLNGWKTTVYGNRLIEYIQWNSKIITHNKRHFVKTRFGEDCRGYGPCQIFAEGDYIARAVDDKTDVWVIPQKDFII